MGRGQLIHFFFFTIVGVCVCDGYINGNVNHHFSPCGGCAKKGLTAEQCIVGCEACRRARIRCEEGKPCRRCRDMNLECTDGGTITIQPPLTPPHPSGKSNRVGDRVKLACLSCRRDNKKVGTVLLNSPLFWSALH
jgi:hypothetical protein